MSPISPRKGAAEHAALRRGGAIALLVVALLAAHTVATAGGEGSTPSGRFLGVAERRERLETPDGTKAAWFARADRPDTTMPGILILEPRGTDRAASRERARLLASLGAAVLVLTVDSRDEATTSTLSDARAGFDWLRSLRSTSDQPLAAVGIGEASAAAVRLASIEPRLAACAVDRRVAETEGFAASQMKARLVVLPAPLAGKSPLGSRSTDALLRFLGETILPGLPAAEGEDE